MRTPASSARATKNTAKLLGGPEVQHYHQALAVVGGVEFEEARAAAALIDIAYEAQDGAFDLAANKDKASDVPSTEEMQAKSGAGDFEGAFAAAPVKIDQTYTTPDQSHAMMEPPPRSRCGRATSSPFWTSNQMIAGARPTSPRR